MRGILVAILMLVSLPARALSVDVELVLLVDVSFSIDAADHALQKQGYADAFRHPALHRAIRTGMLGRIAVTYVEYDKDQRQLVGWTLIDGRDTALRFADALTAAPRHHGGAYTGLGAALGFARPLFAGNGFEGLRQVIDVSGDGPDNTGRDTMGARDAALADGATVNGIVIGRQERARVFYAEEVVGGPRAFLLVAEDFRRFREAILEKLVLEIASPWPASPWPLTPPRAQGHSHPVIFRMIGRPDVSPDR